MTSDAGFQFETDTILESADLLPEPYSAVVGRCGGEPIRRGDVVELSGGEAGPADLHIASILRAGRGVELDLFEHGHEILLPGRVGILLLTGPPAALATLRPNTTLRGTHAPVTDDEIVASLRPVAV